ncbi:MAG: cell division protein [Gammaproteobacteria bacterium]|jgi:cell division transport system permease protein|nr:cell division protein [Gammaproteobacteria bacterium]
MKTQSASRTLQNPPTSTAYSYSRLSALWDQHRQAARISIHRICRHPLGSVLTLLVIGVALALPTLLSVLLGNGESLSQHWSGGTQITVYLSENTNAQRAEQIMTLLKERYQLKNARYISPEEGLVNFERDTGIEHVVEQLRKNPLPGIIEIMPEIADLGSAQVQTWLNTIRQFPGVENVQLDLAWVNRLQEMARFANRLVHALALLLGMVVLLVIGNTIRLSTQNRREEIKIAKLIGATDAFIRRPFLYTGFFYGLLGALLSWLVVSIVILWLRAPITQLAASYQSVFQLRNLSFMGAMELLLAGALLGFAGALIAVNLQIRQIEPD